MTNNAQKPTDSDGSQNAMPSSESPYIPTSLGAKQTTLATPTPEKDEVRQDYQVDVTPSSVVIESKKGSSGFKKFLFLGIFIILLIYGGVTYLYFQNQDLKSLIETIPSNTNNEPTPSPTFNPTNISIKDGSVVYKDSSDSVRILVGKDTFPTTGITGFSRVVVSPDKTKLCFESIPPATKPALYISGIDGNNPVLISSNKEKCLWKSDSSTIIYQGKSVGISNVNIYKYDTISQSETNLTGAVQEENVDYTVVGFSSDESQLICSFINTSDEIGQCQIDLETGEFKVL